MTDAGQDPPAQDLDGEWKVVWLNRNLGRAEYWMLFKGCKAEQKISRIMFDSSNMSSPSKHDAVLCTTPALGWKTWRRHRNSSTCGTVNLYIRAKLCSKKAMS